MSDITPNDLPTRFAKLETSVDWIKVIGAILVAVMLGGFTLLSTQIINLGARIDGTNARLSDEFRAMRAELSAQTAAIASSITAARQVQPQIVVLPPPAPPRP